MEVLNLFTLFRTILSVSALMAVLMVVFLVGGIQPALAAGEGHAAGDIIWTDAESEWIGSSRELRVELDANHPPLAFADHDGVIQGLVSDYLAAIHEMTGLQFSLRTSEAEGADIWIGEAKARTEHDHLRFTDPIFSAPVVIFSKEGGDNTGAQSLLDLHDRTVAVVAGFGTERTLRGKHPRIKLAPYDSATGAIQAVVAGKADAYVGDLIVGAYLIRRLGIDGLHMTGFTPYSAALVFGLPSTDEIGLRVIEKALAAIPHTVRDENAIKWVRLPHEHIVEHQHGVDWILVVELLGILGTAGALGALWAYQIRNRNRDLDAARQRAEEAVEARSLFLATVSHEVRTPMNGVISMAGLIDRTDLNVEQRGMTRVILESASTLLTILNDILDFSKIEAGKLEIESMSFSPLDVCESSAELLAVRAEDNALRISVLVDPNVPNYLIGDPSRIRQVLLNLLGNAIKFTDKGSVSLTCTTASSTVSRLRFEVNDTGIGISDDHRASLFQAFAQGDRSVARRYGGTGLGLSICQRLVVLMGGEIGCDSKEGQGTTFWFELPFENPQVSATPVAEDTSKNADPLNGLRVTVVGFDDLQGHAVQSYLKAAGAEVSEINGGVQAVSSGVDLGDVVFVHANPPDIPGLDVARSIMSTSSAPPVLLAASRFLASTLGEAGKLGVFATLSLPIRRHRLINAVAASVGREQLSAMADDTDDFLRHAPPPKAEAEAACAVVLVAEDNPTNRIVIEQVLGRLGIASEIAPDGMSALEAYDPARHGMLLTDYHMPDMDGLELAREIRTRETANGSGRLPIVALTADALPGTAEICRRAGMDGYLTKPIDPRELQAEIEVRLPRALALRRRVETAPAVNEIIPDVDERILDLAYLATVFGSVNDLAVESVRKFSDGLPGRVDQLVQLIQEDAFASARGEAHALKGACLSLGIGRLGGLAGDIQDMIDGEDYDGARLMSGSLQGMCAEFKENAGRIGA